MGSYDVSRQQFYNRPVGAVNLQLFHFSEMSQIFLRRKYREFSLLSIAFRVFPHSSIPWSLSPRARQAVQTDDH